MKDILYILFLMFKGIAVGMGLIAYASLFFYFFGKVLGGLMSEEERIQTGIDVLLCLGAFGGAALFYHNPMDFDLWVILAVYCVYVYIRHNREKKENKKNEGELENGQDQ